MPGFRGGPRTEHVGGFQTVKLLFDQNLFHKLVQRLADAFPGSEHLRNLGLSTADDTEVWAQAANLQMAIVTKDEDFFERSALHGHPPKVIWIRLGNCTNDAAEQVLCHGRSEIDRLERDDQLSCLVLIG